MLLLLSLLLIARQRIRQTLIRTSDECYAWSDTQPNTSFERRKKPASISSDARGYC